jgi:hypothetical protein
MIPPPPPKQEGPGLIEDLVDIFAAPAKVFARRAKAGGGLAFLFVTLVLGAVQYSGKNVMEPIIDAQIRKGIETAKQRNPGVTDEQLQAAVPMQRKVATVMTIAGIPIALLVVGLLVWVVGKIFGASVTYGSSLMIASFAWVPRIIGGVLVDVQGLLMDDVSKLVNMSQLSIGPARFLDPVTANPFVLAALLRVDLFTLWSTVLIGVAYLAAGKVSKEKAIMAAATVWLVPTILALVGAIFQR